MKPLFSGLVVIAWALLQQTSLNATVTRGPYLQTQTKEGVTIRWRTDSALESRVRFGLAVDNLVWEVADVGLVTDHGVTLTNLAAGTKYYYAVGSGSGLLGGADYYFHTPPDHPQPVRIWAIGDAGTASLGSTAPLAVRDAYQNFSGTRRTDVWLMLGDNAYFSGTDQEYQEAVFDVYPDLLRTTPLWPTLGNHETYSMTSDGHIAYYDIFSLPRNGQAGGVPSGDERYYSFDYANIHFVCLDSELSSKAVGGVMLTWLEQDLAAATAQWLIAYWHSPPYSHGEHNSDLEENLIGMRETVVPLLEGYGVDLVLCGHSHSYERSYLMHGHYGLSSSLHQSMILNNGSGRPEEGGSYQKSVNGDLRGAVYVVAGSAGQTSGGTLDHPAMYVALNRLGSVVIDVDSNRLEAKFVRENGLVDDHFTITKGSVPPAIVSGPSSQVIAQGNNATFNVTVVGTPPLAYQWLFNESPILDATNSSVVVTGAVMSSAGVYSVTVTNGFGSAQSAGATLTVLTNGDLCRPISHGLVAWWPGEGDANDAVGSNDGQLMNGASFADGIVGQGFKLDGVNDFVLVPDSASLDLTGQVSVALWFKADRWGAGQGLIDKRTYYDCNYGAFVNLSYGLQVYYANPTLPGSFRFSHSPIPSAGVFHQFVGTFRQADASHVEVNTYIDGALVQSDLFDGNLANAVNDAPIAIGSERGGVADFFAGIIDEVTIYNRILSESEVLAAFRALSTGECVPRHPAEVVTGPSSRTVVEGGTAELRVTAEGTQPLNYQWRFNGQTVQDATNSLLVLHNVQLEQGGTYSVVVSNQYGVATSVDAILTVLTNGSCVPRPGLIAFWAAEGDARDSIGTNHGQLMSGAGFAEGRVGQGFSLDGVNDFVLVPDSPSLDLSNEFSLECWFKATAWAAGQGLIDKRSLTDCNYGAFINLQVGFQLYFGESGGSSFFSPSPVPSVGVFHHFVGTFRQVDPTRVELKTFIDGLLARTDVVRGDLSRSMNSAPIAIGSERGGVADFFNGVIDEVALYNRALSEDEVSAAFNTSSQPCGPGAVPLVVGQPTGQSVLEGNTVSLDVTASGTPPLFYQWWIGETPIAGATNTVLTLSNIQLNQSGGYFVIVSNAFGVTTSSVAQVVVLTPPSVVQAKNVTAPAGGTAQIPVELIARGTENAVGFSLTFNSALLRFATVELVDDLSGRASLILNTNEVQFGRLGIAVALSAGVVFPEATHELLRVTMDILSLSPQTGTVGFGDQPTAREVSDRLARPVSGVYMAGTVTVTPAEFEGDVAPRPTGDRQLSIVDWVQEGRFAAGLDQVPPEEFQRADCAPRPSKGNGVISVADWVQGGRYAAGLEPATPVGGPLAPSEEPSGGGGFVAAADRVLSIPATNVPPGGVVSVPVLFASQGNENAIGFSVAFDTNLVRFTAATASPSLSQATLFVNSDFAALGRVGVAFALPTGTALTAGSTALVSLTFESATNAAGSIPLSLIDTPVVREAVDVAARTLAATYTPGLILFSEFPPGPRLSASRSGPALILYWPASPGFNLYSAPATTGAAWTKVPGLPLPIGDQMIISVSLEGSQQFFRLARP